MPLAERTAVIVVPLGNPRLLSVCWYSVLPVDAAVAATCLE